MSLQTRLEALVSAIGADIKSVQSRLTLVEGSSGAAGTKVSVLPTASSLDGSELVPIVQGGVTEKVPMSIIRPWNEQILTTTYSNSTVTATDVLAGFTPLANTRYLVDGLFSVLSAAATTGLQLGLAGPSTGITRAAVKVISSSNGAADAISHQGLNAFQASTQLAGVASLLSFQAIIEVGTPGAGAIRPQVKSEVAASAVQVFPGSSMRWRVI